MMNGVKRRTVFCIRDFPKGCGPNAIPHSTPLPIESSSTANGVNVEAASKLKEEIRVSNANDSKNHQIEPAQNGILDPSEGAKISGKAKEAALDSEKNINETAVGEKACDFKGYAVSQRRKLWAVRDFPVGCGRGAPKTGRGPVASSESKVADDGAEVGSSANKKAESFEKAEAVETLRETRGEAVDKASKVASSSGEKKKLSKKPEGDVKRNESNRIQVKTKEAGREAMVVDDATEVGYLMKRKTESFEKAEDDEIIGETVREMKGEAIGKALKVVSSSGEKKKPLEKLGSDVRKNESNRIQVKAKEASREDKVKSPKVEGSVRVSLEVKKNDTKKIKHDVQESGGAGRIKPFSKNSLRENIMEENREKKIEGRDGKQVEKNHHDKESRDARVSSGIKIANKVDMVGKPADKGSISIPKDNKSIKKIKLPHDEGNEYLDAYGDRLVVQALKSAENCPWRKGKGSGGIISRSFTPNTKTKKVTKFAGTSSASLHKNIVDVEDDEDSLLQDGGNEKALVIYNSCRELDVTMTPSVPSRLISKGNSSNEEVANRNKVKKVLRLFQLITRKLTQGEEKSKGKEAKSKDCGNKRVDLVASSILKENNEWVNRGEPIIGHVPGVEVGDEFHYRVELSIIGLHRLFQGGIDYTKRKNVLLATSIVASGGYPDDVDNSDVLIYSGSGGNASGSGDKQAGDQKLERGNLALKNSIDAQTPVRVIYGSKELGKSDSRDAKSKMITTFTYDGLYIVEKYWEERGTNNFIVYKFQLRRLPGQPEIALKEIRKVKKSNVREGLCVKDISNGRESIPICAVNTIDNELPMPFKYISKVLYPSSYVKKVPKGCDCTGGCSDSDKCACAMKNGGEIPYNFNGAIVQAKVLVYECGPSCKCPPSCHNRVSQHGIKLPLEIFKTGTRGWGVRSLYSIPSGTFVCEYVGEMLQDSEAEQRINDEYLFDIGHNYDDHALWDGLPSFVPGMQSDAPRETLEDVGFTIDAAKCGNVGRFINHSCSPNLYAQNVLYDHDENKMPHVMFFAIDNIPPLQELTYHYNYTLDQVRDSEGNIKKKECFCGSPECTGRLY